MKCDWYWSLYELFIYTYINFSKPPYAFVYIKLDIICCLVISDLVGCGRVFDCVVLCCPILHMHAAYWAIIRMCLSADSDIPLAPIYGYSYPMFIALVGQAQGIHPLKTHYGQPITYLLPHPFSLSLLQVCGSFFFFRRMNLSFWSPDSNWCPPNFTCTCIIIPVQIHYTHFLHLMFTHQNAYVTIIMYMIWYLYGEKFVNAYALYAQVSLCVSTITQYEFIHIIRLKTGYKSPKKVTLQLHKLRKITKTAALFLSYILL